MPHTTPWTVGTLLLVVAQTAGAAVSSTGGLEVEQGDYSFKLGGRLMWDLDSFDGVLNLANDGERRFNGHLRRARLELSGDLPGDLDWVFDVNYLEDGSGGEAEIHAAGLRYRGWSVAEVFVGRTKEPFGLEELTSSKAITTMRRNLLTEATDADNQPHYGIRFDGAVGPVRWAAGAFNPNGNPKDADGSDRIALTGRVFGTPIRDDGRVLHLGAAYTDRNLDQAEEIAPFRLRIAESGERISTALLLTREDRQAGLEALYVDGPFSLQGEYFRRDLRAVGGEPDVEIESAYLQAAWTLTGESRGYDSEAGVPGMVAPAGPRGAVEVVARVEQIGSDRSGGADPDAQVFLVGANWYPNRNVKLMFNATWVDTSSLVTDAAGEDDGLALSGRIQLAF